MEYSWKREFVIQVMFDREKPLVLINGDVNPTVFCYAES